MIWIWDPKISVSGPTSQRLTSLYYCEHTLSDHLCSNVLISVAYWTEDTESSWFPRWNVCSVPSSNLLPMSARYFPIVTHIPPDVRIKTSAERV